MWVTAGGPEPGWAGATTSVIMELLRQHDSEGSHPLMSSSPIAMLVAHRPTAVTPPEPVTDGERPGLLVALSELRDPRDPRGRRYPLASMLAAAVCAVMAGACTFAAMADWLRDLDPSQWTRLGFAGKVPVPSTLWRLLTRIDDTALSEVLTRWVRSRTAPVRPAGRRWRRVIAIDGKVLRGARLPGGRQVHLLSAFDTTTGTVIAYVQVSVKSNEIPAFTSKLGWGPSPGSCSSRTPCTRRPAMPMRSPPARPA